MTALSSNSRFQEASSESLVRHALQYTPFLGLASNPNSWPDSKDWKKYEISFKLKKQGAMKHMSGALRCVNPGFAVMAPLLG